MLLSLLYICYIKRETVGCSSIRSMSSILSVLLDDRLLLSPFYVCYIKRVLDGRLLLSPFYICYI